MLDYFESEPETADGPVAICLFFCAAAEIFTNAWNLFVIKEGTLEMIGYDTYPGLDQTVLDALGEIDPSTRTELFEQATEGVCETNAFAFLYKEKGVVAHIDSVDIPERADSRVYWTQVSMGG